ncbi:plastocyanin/azurin family copper-binding protein [Methylophaga sp. OBS3]|uniref:plastocyanin/azurin family copper-binding protein n=1 Tax=Methylophaga sp. OBS3 TaxID=2991934 RepID=UPI00224ED97B|nr:plastocyanin/azurin family copper-binding protein [Methylophaga sp. OBS3]MCX4189783.1 plastocyanin/azurin family copper-binding protein [Methylophaga sp. OBS3]
MRKSKAIISAVIIAAIAIFVVAVVSTVITGGSENYQRPSTSPVPSVSEADPAPESSATEEAQVSDEAQAALADEEAAMEDSVTEEVVDATSEVVDSATEAAVETSEAVADKANEAIAAAEEAAAEGREQAEQMLEEVSQEAEKVVAPPAEEVKATGKVHTVTAQGLVYNPLVIQIAPGDSVGWTNMSTHDTQSIEGLIPEGAEPWHSAMSENFQRTFTQEGIYIYKCTPHFGAGMGGAIIVGQPVNLEQVQAFDAKGATKRLVSKALQVAESM